jgi:uncharacterized protein (TIGR00156 family)
MKRYIVFFCLALFFAAVTVHGQGFTGPGSKNSNRSNNRQTAITASQTITINEVKNLPKDSWVRLTGNIVNSLPGGKYYTFRNSSGEITVEIDWKIWRGLSAGITETVEISGEVEIKRGQVIIEVKAIAGTGRINTLPGQAVTINQPITISEARGLPNNSWVILTGNIVNALRDENYTFRDSSGDIIIEIDKDVWRGLSVGVSDRVEISGELKIKRGQVSVEAEAIRKI